MIHNLHPFQLLEINVISSQHLAPVSKSMRTYAVVWVNPQRKLTTRVDQNGHTNPQWNEKFVFRVDESFLEAETSSIMIEIYAAAWLRDVQIGAVKVLVSNLFPSTNNNSKMRYVALQIRRPSGKPQGILNLGVQLLDSTKRSMPLYTMLSASGVGYNDYVDSESIAQLTMEEKTTKLRRTKSDRSSLTGPDDNQKRGGIGGSSMVNGGSLINASNMFKSTKKVKDNGNCGNGNGSMVNGSLCNSDVGPSASVVAAAIARGLIKTPANAVPHNADGSIVDDWTDNESVEGLRTKLERWRAELPPVYDNDVQKMKSKGRRRSRRRGQTKPFSCFGNAFGLEISITCGGGNTKRKQANQKNKVYHLSSIHDDQSYVSR